MREMTEGRKQIRAILQLAIIGCEALIKENPKREEELNRMKAKIKASLGEKE